MTQQEFKTAMRDSKWSMVRMLGAFICGLLLMFAFVRCAVTDGSPWTPAGCLIDYFMWAMWVGMERNEAIKDQQRYRRMR